MILGIGVDTIEIERFALWHTYSKKKLLRIFSSEEIEYCLENSKKSAERFAVRFAAREALYKALSQAYPNNMIPFLTLCSHTILKKRAFGPVIEVNSDCGIDSSQYSIHLSLSHCSKYAMAFVVIERK